MTNRGAGRPETPRGSKGAQVQVRFSNDEKSALDAHAERMSTSVQDVIRSALKRRGLLKTPVSRG